MYDDHGIIVWLINKGCGVVSGVGHWVKMANPIIPNMLVQLTGTPHNWTRDCPIHAVMNIYV